MPDRAQTLDGHVGCRWCFRVAFVRQEYLRAMSQSTQRWAWYGYLVPSSWGYEQAPEVENWIITRSLIQFITWENISGYIGQEWWILMWALTLPKTYHVGRNRR